MFDFRILVAGAGAAALLAGCSASYDEARRMPPSGSDYAKALHAGYLALARAELDEADFDDAREFSLRARSAALGNPEPLENMDSRLIPAAHRAEVDAAHARLLAVFARGARAEAAAEAAGAQLGYECWTQELEENFQPQDIAACKKSFETAMATLELSLAPRKAALGVPPQVEGPTASPTVAKLVPVSAAKTEKVAHDTKFTVFFDLDKADLKDLARREVDRAVAAARRLGASVIKLTGHADRAGAVAYNKALSARRAQSVAGAMAQLDGTWRRIETVAKGEDDPAVATPDGRAEPRNRRVEIELIN